FIELASDGSRCLRRHTPDNLASFVSASSAEMALHHRGSASRRRLAAAIAWLRRHNPLVQQLLCQAETLHGHFSRCLFSSADDSIVFWFSDKQAAFSQENVELELAPV